MQPDPTKARFLLGAFPDPMIEFHGEWVERRRNLYSDSREWHIWRMTKEALAKAVQRNPFQPFALRLADGRAVRVPHQDFISMHPTGRTVIVYGQNEDLEILDVMLITGLQLPGKSAKAK